MSKLPKQPVSGNFKFYPNTLCRVFLNDIPIFQGFEGAGFSHDGGINHFLVPGENELKLEVLAAPPPKGGRLAYEPDPSPQMGARDMNQTVSATIYKERWDENGKGTGEFVTLLHVMFPDLWQHVPKEDRHMPYMHVAKFDPGVHVPELAFLDAPLQDIPCEGTKELHDAVRELHEAFLKGDASRLKDLMKLQITEYDAAYSGGTRSEQLQSIDDLVSEKLVVAPLAWDRMHFHARAHGKLVHVERLDRAPVFEIQTIGKPQGHMSDPVFTHHEGRWQLM